jgi:hypothetical protein
MITFNGLGMNLGNLTRLSNAESRSISAENFNGEKGKGGMAEVASFPPPQWIWGRAGRCRRASC